MRRGKARVTGYPKRLPTGLVISLAPDRISPNLDSVVLLQLSGGSMYAITEHGAELRAIAILKIRGDMEKSIVEKRSGEADLTLHIWCNFRSIFVLCIGSILGWRCSEQLQGLSSTIIMLIMRLAQGIGHSFCSIHTTDYVVWSMEYLCSPSHEDHGRPGGRFFSLNKRSSPHASIGLKCCSVGALTVFNLPRSSVLQCSNTSWIIWDRCCVNALCSPS